MVLRRVCPPSWSSLPSCCGKVAVVFSSCHGLCLRDIFLCCWTQRRTGTTRKKKKERQKDEEIGNDAKIAEKAASNGANRESGSQYQEKSETDTGTNFESAKHSHNSKRYVCGINFPNPGPAGINLDYFWVTRVKGQSEEDTHKTEEET